MIHQLSKPEVTKPAPIGATCPANYLLGRLWGCINGRRRKQFALLVALMVATSFSELISIGLVMPFLGVLVAPERVFEMPVVQTFVGAFDLKEPRQILLPLTCLFGLAALIAGIMRLTLLWANTRLSFAVGADLGIEIYRRTLHQPYEVHCIRNSSEIIDGISNKSNAVIYGIIVPLLMLISSTIIVVAILVAMLIIQPTIALASLSGVSLIYMVIILATRKRLRIDSERMAAESRRVIKSLQEGLGGIREVIIQGNQEVYCKIFREADLSLRRAQGNSLFIGLSPRYAVEAIGMLVIGASAYFFADGENGLANAIPLLGAMALAAQRLLPVLQQIYGSVSQVKSNLASLRDALELLDQPLPNCASGSECQLSFNSDITLKRLDFRYATQKKDSLRQINLTIKKGSRCGFVGVTGSGKSTLLDIVMGLLHPTEGALMIDGKMLSPDNYRSWQSQIAHVPQTIFMADITVAENIALGIPTDLIDHTRVKRAAQLAQIASDIESWPKKYETLVGERGIRLSGGQRQRIGIARALYKRAQVIVFDEATSALDLETERQVIRALDELGEEVTLLIIAHRLTTLRNCSQIVELEDGVITRVGSYREIIKEMQ